MTAKPIKTKKIPPDGGWGWVVLGSALVVNFLIPGTVKSFGVLFVEFLHVFKASSTAASWMPALCYFLYNSLGPLSSILSTKYSYKTVTLIGGTFAASGMMLSYFASSVPYLYVSYGIMVGIGAGLSFPPTIYIVTAYFERLRGFANGLCISGSAIGTIVLPPFLQYLLDCFGYRGAVLIMGAITLNTLVCGLLYHPVEQHMITVPVEEGIDNEALTLDEPSIETKKSALNSQDTAEKQQNLSEFLDHKILDPSKDTSEGEKVEKAEEERTQISISNEIISDVVENLSKDNDKDRENKDAENKDVEKKDVEKKDNDEDKEVALTKIIVPEKTETPTQDDDNEDKKEEDKKTVEAQITASPRRGSAITSFVSRSNSKVHPKIYKISVQDESDLEKSEKSKSKCALSLPRPSISESTSKLETTKPKWKSRFFDLSVLKDPIYLVILISNSTSAISNTNFMILLPSYAITQGFDKNSSALLLSVVSALDLVGRIGGASLSDIDFVPKYYYFVGGLGTSGIALALLPMATSYTMLAFFCALFGLSSGMYIGITTVILADMLGMEKLSSSYGISLFVNGVLQLVGPPVCGVIYETVGSYKPIFLAFGIILILGTALWAVVPLLKRVHKKDVEAV